MENASKALIIAGAILISILLIAVGVYIYQSSMGTVEESVSSMSDQEKQIFNQKFENYAGTNIKGSSVKSLISAVIANNSTYDGDAAKTVSVNGNNASTDLSTTRNNVRNASRYNVTLTYSQGGLVSTITIEGPGVSAETTP